MLCLRCLFLHRPVTLVSTYVFWTAPCPECDVFKSFCTLKSTRNCQTSTFLQNVWSVGFEIDRPCPQWCNWSGVSAAQVAKRSWISSCIFSRGQLLILLCECTYVYLHNVPPTDVSISCSLTLFWQRMKNVCISALFFFQHNRDCRHFTNDKTVLWSVWSQTMCKYYFRVEHAPRNQNI